MSDPFKGARDAASVFGDKIEDAFGNAGEALDALDEGAPERKPSEQANGINVNINLNQ
jgi:hypothetical protein